MNQNIIPFVKWVGGKRQFIKYIETIIPNEFKNYHEPFVGGGAVFFHLLKTDRIKEKAYINDLNKRLMITYKTIKSNPAELMKALDEYEIKSNEDFYINERKNILGYKTYLEISSWFIYVNKAGFNGLYRVNSSGGFNVPYGKNDNKSLYNKEKIISTSKAIKTINLKITSNDYKKSFLMAKKGDFVFIDPPYDYEENKKNGFTSYTYPDFKKNMQIELSEEIKILNDRGVYFLLSNHNTKLINKLYSKFDITILKANRFINSDASKRSKSSEEVFIKNF